MKRKLLAIGLLTASIAGIAQVEVSHVEPATLVHVQKGTLWYNGGGLLIKGDGKWENKGNVMLEGTATDKFQTVDAANAAKTEASAGANFVNILNEPANFAAFNTTQAGTAAGDYTYGQLYIKGLTQANITGFVDQEFRNVNHGIWEQIALPFNGKTLSTLSTELGKSFSNERWSMNEIQKYNNAPVRFDNLSTTSTISDPTGYFILGNAGGNTLNVSTITRTVKGVPYADALSSVAMSGAGAAVTFGAGGSNKNSYTEKYNTYVQDNFEIASGGTAWTGNFGKNIYQFGNPFLTNLDLKPLFWSNANDGATAIANLYGIRVEQPAGNVGYTKTAGGGNTTGTARYITKAGAAAPTGDVDWLIVRPLSVFSIKLRDAVAATINFNNLRRFNYMARTDFSNPYTVNAARVNSPVSTAKTASTTSSVSSGDTTKQLGVIALDANGNEIGRTYYVVHNSLGTGVQSNMEGAQIANDSKNVLGTYEEKVDTGSYDNNVSSKYWLYINQANETDFAGKEIPMVMYSSNIKSLKFELREDAALVPAGTTALSAGKSFFIKLKDGNVHEIAQNEVIPAGNVSDSGTESQLYYDRPSSTTGVLATKDVKPSRTMVAYESNVDNYVVFFDPNWKTADITVYDMSGKLVISASKVNAQTPYEIKLSKLNNAYVVNVVSDKGEKVSTKILR